MEELNCSSGKTRFHRLFRGKIDHQRSILVVYWLRQRYIYFFCAISILFLCGSRIIIKNDL